MKSNEIKNVKHWQAQWIYRNEWWLLHITTGKWNKRIIIEKECQKHLQNHDALTPGNCSFKCHNNSGNSNSNQPTTNQQPTTTSQHSKHQRQDELVWGAICIESKKSSSSFWMRQTKSTCFKLMTWRSKGKSSKLSRSLLWLNGGDIRPWSLP